MTRKLFARLVGGVVLSLAAIAAPADAADCDRGCLEKMVDGYIDAMIAHQPDRLGAGTRARYTENGQTMPIGEGIWRTASGRGAYRLVIADPQSSQVGFVGVIQENGTPAIIGLRLKHDNGRITEAEMVVGRSKEGAERLEALGKPDPLLLAPVPAAARVSRDKLMAIGASYFTNMAGGDPTKITPFAPDCDRLENGTRTTNNAEAAAKSTRPYTYIQLGCEAQFKTGYFKIVTAGRSRMVVVDEERQIVFGFAFLDHAGDVKQVKVSDGRTVPIGLLAPFTWELAELFQIENGKIRRIEAVLNSVPYKMVSGWGDTAF
jgi:hypothetical protein